MVSVRGLNGEFSLQRCVLPVCTGSSFVSVYIIPHYAHSYRVFCMNSTLMVVKYRPLLLEARDFFRRLKFQAPSVGSRTEK